MAAFSKQENQVWYVRCSLQVSYMQQYTLGVYLVLVRAVMSLAQTIVTESALHYWSQHVLFTLCVLWLRKTQLG